MRQDTNDDGVPEETHRVVVLEGTGLPNIYASLVLVTALRQPAKYNVQIVLASH